MMFQWFFWICLSAEVNAILNKNRASAAGHVSFSLNISFLLAPKVQNECAMEQLLVTVKVLELKDLEPIYLLDESILLYEINYDKYQVDLSISRVRRDVYNNVRNLM